MKPLSALSAVALLLAATQAQAAAASVTATNTPPGGLVSSGLEARFKTHVGNWDQMITANGSFGGAGTTADLSNSRDVLYNNWMDLALSFSADSRTLTWSLSDEAFGSRSLRTVEADPLQALRIEFRTTAPAFELRWADLAFNGGVPAGDWLAAGSASGASSVRWLVADAGTSLSAQDWILTGRLLATGGNNENTRLSIQGLMAPVSPVPEPAPIAMLLAGLGVVALLGRRRLAQAR
jgi:hypothetical protein